jgi:hypothetical protein
MAFVKNFTITSDAGTVYADTDAWIAAHGPCGTGHDFPSTMVLTEAKTGVIVNLTYEDEAECVAHEAEAIEAEGPGSGAGTTWVINSRG